jgi:hypothetical protein
MDIRLMSNGNYYIQIPAEELTAAPKLSDLLRKLPPQCPGAAFFEVYYGACGALVFARAREGEPSYFAFPDIERVISAAAECPEELLSFLARYEAGYALIVYPWREESPPGALYEFGAPLSLHKEFAQHLAEQGKILLGPSAIAGLRRIFAPRRK